MAFLGKEFELDDLPAGGRDFEPIPAGVYMAKITQAELKATKAGNGEYISLRFDIIGPTHQGRVVFSNLNIKNPSQKAEEIGQSQLGDIMRAIGIGKVRDTDQLVGGDLNIKVVVKNDEVYGNKNEVKAFSAINGSAPPKAAKAAGAKPNQDANKAPWES